jgi:hypothetical protein
MRIPNLVGSILTTAITLAMLVGCAGGSQVPPTAAFQNRPHNGFRLMLRGIGISRGATAPDFMDRRALAKPLVFISYGGTIGIYQQGGKNKMVGQITVPSSLDVATDAEGNLYSANVSFSSTSVTVYAPPYTKGPKLTLNGRTSFPIAVSRRGTVAIFGCTIPSGTQCGSGFLFYAAGSTTPCATVLVDASTFPGVFGAAFDGKVNLYFDSPGSGTEAPLPVGRISGGCNANKVETFTTANTTAYAGGIKVDRAGRIAILTAAATSPYMVAIDTYDPPKKGSLGSPVSTTPLPGTLVSNSGSFAYQASGRGFWTGEEQLGASYASGASEFAYPAGGSPKKTVTGAPKSQAYGVAVTPALVP